MRSAQPHNPQLQGSGTQTAVELSDRISVPNRSRGVSPHSIRDPGMIQLPPPRSWASSFSSASDSEVLSTCPPDGFIASANLSSGDLVSHDHNCAAARLEHVPHLGPELVVDPVLPSLPNNAPMAPPSRSPTPGTKNSRPITIPDSSRNERRCIPLGGRNPHLPTGSGTLSCVPLPHPRFSSNGSPLGRQPGRSPGEGHRPRRRH